jgi:hypothetical protein
MNTRHASLPMPIMLGSSPLRRLSHWVAEQLHDASERARRAAGERAERRLARSHHALYASLDARTLRDIGLGDWADPGRDADTSAWQRTSSLRGF